MGARGDGSERWARFAPGGAAVRARCRVRIVHRAADLLPALAMADALAAAGWDALLDDGGITGTNGTGEADARVLFRSAAAEDAPWLRRALLDGGRRVLARRGGDPLPGDACWGTEVDVGDDDAPSASGLLATLAALAGSPATHRDADVARGLEAMQSATLAAVRSAAAAGDGDRIRRVSRESGPAWDAFPCAWAEAAEALAALGRGEDAVEVAALGLSRFPSSRRMARARAVGLAAAGRGAEARRVLSRAGLSPLRDPRLLAALGRADRGHVRCGESGAPARPALPLAPRVLMLSAHPPRKTSPFADVEARAIGEALERGAGPGRISLFTVWAATLPALRRDLTRHAPGVVHFAGHGDTDGRLHLVGEDGGDHPIPVPVLADLFAEVGRSVGLVVLSACYLEIAAQALCDVVPCAIGMAAWTPAVAGIVFSAALHRALAEGCSVRDAFDHARGELAAVVPERAALPRLYHRRDVDPTLARLSLGPEASP